MNSASFEVRVIILFQLRTAKKIELGFQILCFSMYISCMHGQFRKDTVGKRTDQHSNYFRYFSVIFSNYKDVAHLFEEFGLLDFSVAR